jgi:hypothetical protein
LRLRGFLCGAAAFPFISGNGAISGAGGEPVHISITNSLKVKLEIQLSVVHRNYTGHFAIMLILFCIQSVTHHGINSMIHGAETPQFNIFSVLDVLGVAVSPFLVWDIGVGVGIDEDVESTPTFQHWQEGDRSGNLAYNGLDLGVDLGFCLFFLRMWVFSGSRSAVSG